MGLEIGVEAILSSTGKKREERDGRNSADALESNSVEALFIVTARVTFPQDFGLFGVRFNATDAMCSKCSFPLLILLFSF